MSENTKISWCDDSANFWWGCTKDGPGCLNCYAESLSKRYGNDLWGPNAPRRYMPNAAATLRKLNRKAQKEGRQRLVFLNSMSDFFERHEGRVIDNHGRPLLINCGRGADGNIYPEGTTVEDDWGCRPLTIDDLRRIAFRLIDECQDLIFIILTKRPENVREMWPIEPTGREERPIPTLPPMPTLAPKFRENVWLLTSISTQREADSEISKLLKCRDLVPVLGVSAEPLLGAVDLTRIRRSDGWEIDALRGVYSRQYDGEVDEPGGIEEHPDGPTLDWVIIGGESGRNARPFNLDWARSLIRQCREAGVKPFLKQIGSKPIQTVGEGWTQVPVMDPKGGTEAEWPSDLQGCREFPVEART